MKKIIIAAVIAGGLLLGPSSILAKDDTFDYVKLEHKFNKIEWAPFNNKNFTKGTKPIILIVGSTTCGYCKKLKQTMNQDKALRNIIMNNFTPIYVEQDISYLPEYLKTPMTPTIYFLTADSKHLLIDKVVGAPEAGYLTKATLFILKQIAADRG